MAYRLAQALPVAHLRYKQRFAYSGGEFAVAGGSALPDGLAIVAATYRKDGPPRFQFWVYTDQTPDGQVVERQVANMVVDVPSPEGRQPGPNKLGAVLHQIAPGTYRIKTLFLSWRGDNQEQELWMCDSGWNLVKV